MIDRSALKGRLLPYALAAASGLLLLLSFPRFSWEYLAWVALAPLIYAVTNDATRRSSFLLGWVTGLVFTFLAENWIAHSMINYGGLLLVVAYAVALLFAAVLALFPALFALALVELRNRSGVWAIAAVPLLWVASEWLRQAVTGVTWNALGVSQFEHYRVARIAQWGGVYLVSWVVAAVSALLVLLIKARNPAARRAAALVVIQILLPLLLPPPARLQELGDPLERQSMTSTPVTVLGVQPDIGLMDAGTPEDLRRNFERVRELTLEGLKRAGDEKVGIIVWAESPLALFYENDPAVRERVDSLARETGAYLIANTITRDGNRYFNSVHIASPRAEPSVADAALRRYDKIRLVPFGEYVPWRSVLGRFVPAIVGDFAPGREAVTNVLRLEQKREGIALGDAGAAEYQIERETKFIRAGTFICYEAAYPELVREFVKSGATLLVNVSNDAWFGATSGPEQHLAHAVMRAIENDRDLVRVTNSGISALITAEGRVIDELPRFTPATGIWQAQAHRGRTFYTMRGDIFARACAVVAGLAIGASLFIRLRDRRRLRDEDEGGRKRADGRSGQR